MRQKPNARTGWQTATGPPDELRTQRRKMPEIQNSVTHAAARQPSRFMGLPINAPEAIARVKDFLEPPERCHYCGRAVELVSNEVIYGRVFGWPLTYRCKGCRARVGCHPGTDLPLGTLADDATMRARRAAHDAFDPLWQGKGGKARSRAYQALAKAMGQTKAHISWMDAPACAKVVQICKAGLAI
ncbi:zinc-finger-containing protein [Alicycliphilus denitrificans]|uniref:zinc-finger-containing protein n=1 Tax=Alicycliphilus denitrificans TaxID=179636 RepID=UPI0001DA05DB|nr:zinc-finger-containing protein [Alicycliphilus denitrificans]ADV02232.1 hypothetical protein Alide_4632 [Alicycliphilus denitrificans BC]